MAGLAQSQAGEGEANTASGTDLFDMAFWRFSRCLYSPLAGNLVHQRNVQTSPVAGGVQQDACMARHQTGSLATIPDLPPLLPPGARRPGRSARCARSPRLTSLNVGVLERPLERRF